MSANNPQILSDYLAEIEEINQLNLSLRNKYIRLKRVLERSCKEITEGESLQFPSLFARLVFISQKYELPKQLEWQLQNIRVKASFLQKDANNIISPFQYQQAVIAIQTFLSAISGTNRDFNVLSPVEKVTNDTNDTTFYEKLRVVILKKDMQQSMLYCQSNELHEPLIVRYNLQHVNEPFTLTIERAWVGAQLNLIDVKINKNGEYIPRIFVLEPDYLIDASAIAECFQSYASSYLHYFRRKFEPTVNTHYILLGNLANFFLDELIYAADINSLIFGEVFLKSFQLMPFEYASCVDIRKDSDFKEFMIRANIQFDNIKRVVMSELSVNGFNRSECILEPSFFSEKYGFQGRLDLLQLSSEDKGVHRIIELKSGKPPYPRQDATQIAINHETQTVVYRLIIQSVFGSDPRHVYPTILYSSVENKGENLRLAAQYQQLEKEIINTRNLVVATEHDLYAGDVATVENIFTQLFDIDNYGAAPQFFSDKLIALKKIIRDSSPLERSYFFRYINFISRELYLQKMGDEGYDTFMSTSSLWNTEFSDRKESLELISDLEIESIDDSGRGMTIRLRRAGTDDFVNFREGEICILYPRQSSEDSVLTNQIMKGTVMEIATQYVVLRFRYKQQNRNFFARHRYWVVEHDKLDHTYNAMFKSLFAFLASSRDKKELLLGIKEPQSSYSDNDESLVLSKEQKQVSVIEKALASEDYFLIVGPPGTGKTSIFARQLIERLYSNEDNNILVLAYTNRAVDELCSAICEAFNEQQSQCDKYIRIGTELSCNKAYCNRLLQNIAAGVKSRRELLQIIDSTRIVVGTLASIVGRPELFEIKKFSIAIIDEASQILEPQIIGLLPHFDKFIMIGDHKQLSTITLQDEDKSKVDDENLQTIGLNDCRESLFERLYRICLKNNWTNAYDTLIYHGRMHHDIARLVNVSFYDDMLVEATQRQLQPLNYAIFDKKDKYQSLIAARRTAFIAVREVDNNSISDKINESEADEVVNIVKGIYAIYQSNNLSFDPARTIGIIAPYRNQIAQIRHKLKQIGIPELEDIMVDTVERYQGSQRDIIIVSFCFNRPYQMRFFANMDSSGRVDRKLNVALTRAREQLFLVGNDYIMQQNTIYRNLLKNINS